MLNIGSNAKKPLKCTHVCRITGRSAQGVRKSDLFFCIGSEVIIYVDRGTFVSRPTPQPVAAVRNLLGVTLRRDDSDIAKTNSLNLGNVVEHL